MRTKSLASSIALCMLFVFSFWVLGVSGTPSSSSPFPMMQVAAASEKGEGMTEESMEKSKEGMAEKGEKKKMKKKKNNKKKKKGTANKPQEE